MLQCCGRSHGDEGTDEHQPEQPVLDLPVDVLYGRNERCVVRLGQTRLAPDLEGESEACHEPHTDRCPSKDGSRQFRLGLHRSNPRASVYVLLCTLIRLSQLIHLCISFFAQASQTPAAAALWANTPKSLGSRPRAR